MKNKKNSGLSLLETVIAAMLFSILILGAYNILVYVSQSSARTTVRLNALENARVSMDFLENNLQMADFIELIVEPDGTLIKLNTRQIESDRGLPYIYTFSYDGHLPPNHDRYRRLQFGGFNELASNVIEIKFFPEGEKLFFYIIIDATPFGEVRLDSVVNLRGKEFIY